MGATFAAQGPVPDPVVLEIKRALQSDYGLTLRGDPQVEVDEEETNYTFSVKIEKPNSRQARTKLQKRLEDTFEALLADKNWADPEEDSSVSVQIPKKGKRAMIMFDVKNSVKEEWQRREQRIVSIIKGNEFRSEATNAQIVCPEKPELQGDWEQCADGVPEFAFNWLTTKDFTKTELTELRDRVVRAWFKWNKQYRTLQKKIDDNTFWIITMWSQKDMWTIERWTKRSFVRKIKNQRNICGYDKIAYCRPGLHALQNNDQWYKFDLGTFQKGEVSNLKVRDYPTTYSHVSDAEEGELSR